jgi:hypothetical protein
MGLRKWIIDVDIMQLKENIQRLKASATLVDS